MVGTITCRRMHMVGDSYEMQFCKQAQAEGQCKLMTAMHHPQHALQDHISMSTHLAVVRCIGNCIACAACQPERTLMKGHLPSIYTRNEAGPSVEACRHGTRLKVSSNGQEQLISSWCQPCADHDTAQHAASICVLCCRNHQLQLWPHC